MCELKDPLTIDKQTGYKLAVKRDDRFFSITTGQEYIPKNNVPEIPERRGFFDLIFDNRELKSLNPGFNAAYSGYTSVFISEIDIGKFIKILKLEREFFTTLVILKMTICDDLHYSEFGWTRDAFKCVAGKYIDTLEEYEEVEPPALSSLEQQEWNEYHQ